LLYNTYQKNKIAHSRLQPPKKRKEREMAFNYKSCQLVRSNSCLHKAAPIVLIPLYEKYSLALRIASQIAVVFSKKKYFHTSSFNFKFLKRKTMIMLAKELFLVYQRNFIIGLSSPPICSLTYKF